MHSKQVGGRFLVSSSTVFENVYSKQVWGCFLLSSSTVLRRKCVFKASGGLLYTLFIHCSTSKICVQSKRRLLFSSFIHFPVLKMCVQRSGRLLFLVSSWLTHYRPVFKKIFLQSGFFLFFEFGLKSASDSSLYNYLKHLENNNFFDKSIYLGLAWSYLSWPRDNLLTTTWQSEIVIAFIAALI